MKTFVIWGILALCLIAVSEGTFSSNFNHLRTWEARSFDVLTHKQKLVAISPFKFNPQTLEPIIPTNPFDAEELPNREPARPPIVIPIPLPGPIPGPVDPDPGHYHHPANVFMRHAMHNCSLRDCGHAVYVEEQGDDSWDGTFGFPFASIQKGIDKVAPLAVNGTFYAVMVGTGVQVKNFTWEANVFVIGDLARPTQIKASASANPKIGRIFFPSHGINADAGQGAMFGGANLFFNSSDTHSAQVYIDLSTAINAVNFFLNNVIGGIPFTIISNPFSGLTSFFIDSPMHKLVTIIGGISNIFNYITQFFASLAIYVNGPTKIDMEGCTFRSVAAGVVNDLNLYGDAAGNLQVSTNFVSWGTTSWYRIWSGVVKMSGNFLPVKARQQLNGNKLTHTVDTTSIGVPPLLSNQVFSGSPTSMDDIVGQIERVNTIYTPTPTVVQAITLVGALTGSVEMTDNSFHLHGPSGTPKGAATVTSKITVNGNWLILQVPNPITVACPSQPMLNPAVGSAAPGGLATIVPIDGPPMSGVVLGGSTTSLNIKFWIPTGTAINPGAFIVWHGDINLG